MSILKVNQIENRTGSGDIVIPAGNQIVGTLVSNASGSVAQMVYQQARASDSSHILINSTSLTDLPLTVTITPKFSNSVIKVMFYSTMFYAAATPVVFQLQRSIGGGAYSSIVPITGTYPGPYYGWMYSQVTWDALSCFFYDTPATTSSVTYKLQYRNWSSTATNYLVHQSMYYGWELIEIAQ